MAIANFMSLIGLISRAYNAEPTVDSERIMRIGRAIAHMENHYDEVVTLPALARMVGMSARSFYRTFSMATGESPLAYLQKVRLTRAAKILQTTDKSVTEAAFECGFNDSSYFTAVPARLWRVTATIPEPEADTDRSAAMIWGNPAGLC